MKRLLLFLALFLLLYFETSQLGPLTISLLWKIVLLFYLCIVVITSKQITSHKPKFLWYGYFKAFKFLLNPGIYLNPRLELLDFTRHILFPLGYEYLRIKAVEIYKMRAFVRQLSLFIIVSYIPFTLGVMTSNGNIIEHYEGYNASAFGGIFQSIHASSLAIAFSILYLIFDIRENVRRRLVRWILRIVIIFGLYLLFNTYVRTAYLALLVGSAVLLYPKKISPKQVFLFFLVGIMVSVAISYALNTSEVFYNRVFDIRYDGSKGESGSGRIVFWENAIKLWLSGDPIELLFGFGFDKLPQINYTTTGYRVFAHNEFFNQLAQNGLIGVALTIAFLYHIYRFIHQCRSSKYYRVSLAFLICYVSLLFTQGGFWLIPELFLVSILYIVKKTVPE